jgi:dihydroorotase
MSTKKEVNLMKKFQSDKITCEVTTHHLFLAVRDYVKLGNFIKVNPPVRGQHDQDILWQALNERVINIIASDHAPHLASEKEKPYNDAPSGIPELETSLALMLNAVNDEKIDLETVVDLMCKKPAKLYGLKNKGEIIEGFDADLTVIDMNLMQEVSNDRLYTKCGWSPYDGWELKGWPVMTFVNGVLGMKDGKVIDSSDLKGVEVDVE